MSNAVRAIAPIIAIVVSVGNSVSDFTSNTVAIFLWALSAVLVAVAALWPYLKRLRIGFKPPDAELQQLTEERDSWRDNYLESQQRLEEVEKAQERYVQETSELKQERDELRASYEEVAGQLETQVDDKKLKAEADRLSNSLYQLAEKRKTDQIQEKMNDDMFSGTGDKFMELSNVKGKFDDETKALFNKHYESDVWALLDALERTEWCSYDERKEIEGIFTGNWLSDPAEQIRKGAARIAAFGKRY